MTAVVWRYLYGGVCRHALASSSAEYAPTLVSECGTAGAWQDWCGTRTEAERKALAELQPCMKCLAQVGQA